MKRAFKILLTAAIYAAALLLLSCTRQDRYITVTGFAQGGTYSVKMNLKGVSVPPEEIRDSIDAILVNIDNSLSGYNKKSLLSRFNAGESIEPDSLFLDIYSRAHKIFEETEGAVDVAAGPLFDLWGFGFSEGEMPSDAVVAQIREASGFGRLVEDMWSAIGEDGTVDGYAMLGNEGFSREKINNSSDDAAAYILPQLNYNAIAQGYSCDVIAEYLYSIGVKDMLVDIGEFFCDGVNPSGKPWTIGIDRPEDGNNDIGAHLQGIFRAPAGPHGIVTSGNYRKFYVKDGKKYAHTIDPRTGYPVSHTLLSATVVASDAMTADAYATYCMVVGPEEAKAFLSSRPDLEGCLIYDDNGTFRTWCTENFHLEEL